MIFKKWQCSIHLKVLFRYEIKSHLSTAFRSFISKNMVLFFEKNHSPALLSFGGNCALSSSKLILSTIIQYSILKNLWQRYTFILIFARKSKKKVIDEGFFYITRPLLLGEVPHPLLNPPLLRREGLKAWPAGPVRANKRTPLKGLLVE